MSADPEKGQCEARPSEWGEAKLVSDDQLVAKQGVDDPADAVVGQSAVVGFDEFGGGQVPDAVSGVHGGVAEGEQQVGSARAGGADQADVLSGSDPFQRAELPGSPPGRRNS